jgi:hypothetical protein
MAVLLPASEIEAGMDNTDTHEKSEQNERNTE